jgi:beta-lactamase regulating signal transducer with metallopeptidase domain
MMAPDLQNLAQALTGRLLNTAAEGVVLAGLVSALLRVIGRQNSGTRFAIWFSALLAIVALPFLAGSGVGATNAQAFPATNLHREIILSSSWASCLFAAWGVGAGLLLLRISVGLWRVHQIRKNCSDVDIAHLDPATAGIFRDFASHRRVKVCVSNDVAVPAAIGFFRPAIVFPAWLLPQLSAGEMKVILLHELAHLRRWDDWTNLAQKIARAVFFFHPAVWWIENRLTLEREMACDDMVLAQTASPRDYASSLISFAEKLQNARGLALAQALVSRMRHMSLRVTQILDAKRPSRTALWKPVAGVSVGMFAFVFAAAAHAPQFVAFEDQVKPSEVQPIQATTQHGMKHFDVVSRASVIPAAFHLRTAPVPAQSRPTSRSKPAAIRVTAERRERPIPETWVIVQTAQFDASGAGTWTLCVWKVGGRNSIQKQFDSNIVLNSL